MLQPTRLVVVALGLVFAVAACTSSTDPDARNGDPSPTISPQTGRAGGTIDLGVLGEPATLDPYHRAASDLTFALVRPVYPSLFRFRPDGTTYPDLAASIEARGDGVVVALREARWSNGRRIDARDVVASVKRARRPSGFAAVSARATGSFAVRFSGQIEDWERALARAAFVLPRGKAKRTISGGPLQITKRVRGLKIVYRRNRGWGRVELDRLRIFHFHDAGSMRDMVSEGEIDAAVVPSTVNLRARIEDEVTLHRDVGWESIWLDLSHSGLSPDARRALAGSVDRAALEEGFVRGDGRVSHNLFPEPGPKGADGPYRQPSPGDVPDFALAVPQGDELLSFLQRAIRVQLAPDSRIDLLSVELSRFYGRSGRVPAARLVRSAGAPGRESKSGTHLAAVPLFHVATFVVANGVDGIAVNPTLEGPLWNVEGWRRAEDD